MKSSNKLLSILFVLVLFSFTIPIFAGISEQASVAPEYTQSSVTTDAFSQLNQVELNASVLDVTRNITISSTSKVTLEDEFSLKIDGNETISAFNFTIPTVFDQYVMKTTFRVKRDNDLGLKTNDEFIRESTKFIGEEATTYSFSIKDNGTEANSSAILHFYVNLEALHAIQFEGVGEVQKGIFITPIKPLYSNLRIISSLIAVKLVSEIDQFKTSQMDLADFSGKSFPTLASNKILEWANFSRETYDPNRELVENFDFMTVIFESFQPGGEDDLNIAAAISPFIFTSAERHLKVDPWGFVYVTETMTMKHMGASRIDDPSDLNLNHQIIGYTAQFNKNVKITALYDKHGKLNIGILQDSDDPDPGLPDPQYLGDLTVLLINFRNPIYGGEEYTFTVEYMLNATDVVSVQKTNSQTEYSLNATLFSLYNTTILNLKTVYELPAGATLLKSSFRSVSPSSSVSVSTYLERSTLSYFKHVEMEINIVNAAYTDNNQFVIKYTYNGVGYLQYIISFVFTFILLLLVIFAASNVNLKESKTVEVEREKIPVEKISSFLNYFTEQNDAQKTLSDLAEKRKKKKINQKDYTGKVKAVRKRIRENSPLLEEALGNLSKQGAKYERLVSKIMIANQKVVDTKANINNTKKSYTKKAIAKDIYQKLMREYRIEIERQESMINKTLSELRDLTQLY